MTIRRYTAEEYVALFEHSWRRTSRLGCPHAEHMRAMLEAGATLGQLEEYVMCDAGIAVTASVIINTLVYNTESAAASQARYAAAVTMYDWPEARMIIETLLVRHASVIGFEALTILVGHLKEHHPNAPAFLERIADQLPEALRQ